jgi:Reeler domain
MMKSIWNIVTTAAAASLLFGTACIVVVTDAYSTGAGQCIGGTAAVGAPHMTSTAVSGTLQDGAFSITIGDQTSSPAPQVTTNTDTIITISISSSSPQFRGALIRASSPDGVEFTLEPVGDTAQAAPVCTDPGVLGVTHTSNALKSEFSGTLNAATAGTITLDITVVRSQNSQDGSFYYYSPFTVTVVDAEPEIDTSTTSAPVATTTTTATTPAPVAADSTTATTTTPAPAAATEPAPVAAEPAPASAPAAAPAAEPTGLAPQYLTPKAPSSTPKPPSNNKAPTKSSSASAVTALGWWIMVVTVAVATMTVV